MKKILFIVVAVIVFAGCSKEEKIEKNLWKKGGEWGVSSWTSWSDGTKTEHIGADVQSASFSFNKDNEATVVINGGSGDTYTYKMKYYNTESQLKLIDVIDSEAGEIEYPSIFYSMEWKKNNLDIRATGGFAGGDTETLILKKK
ncbi:MAG: membrane lipoprotein lipid attachment site-containing protein [Flavobacteriia bacterium]|nr:membrane lipoprotein lipid attachment site-containing protein [Flavobacteriia bacterium]OJX36694.1 MAG: hypothetical protein BGO87_12930 [Flavobacteriia bacterium 40-80]